MTAEAQSSERLQESNVLRSFQLASEARGLKFYIRPSRDNIPDFLGSYRPDAIARGPEGGIIIEVKHRRSDAADQQLAAISREVSRQKGWEFRVIYLNPSTGKMPPIAKPTWSQLHAALKEVEALSNGRHHAAALVAGWAVLEALARLARVNDETDASTALSPLQAVQTLAEEGFIENEAADRLRRLATLRNAVAHGDLSVDVPAERVSDLIQQLRTTASDIEIVMRKH